MHTYIEKKESNFYSNLVYLTGTVHSIHGYTVCSQGYTFTLLLLK